MSPATLLVRRGEVGRGRAGPALLSPRPGRGGRVWGGGGGEAGGRAGWNTETPTECSELPHNPLERPRRTPLASPFSPRCRRRRLPPSPHRLPLLPLPPELGGKREAPLQWSPLPRLRRSDSQRPAGRTELRLRRRRRLWRQGPGAAGARSPR